MFISTQNSKTGPSFNLPAGPTCPGKTELCASLCYAAKGRMALPFQMARRQENMNEVLQLLKDDRSGLTCAKALDACIKKYKVKSLRIHDSGDFFSEPYTNAWCCAAYRNPDVKFWAYTRSFSIDAILDRLVDLADRDNCAVWLSADMENWELALKRYQEYKSAWSGISWMQTEGSEDVALKIQNLIGAENFVNFAVHGSRSGSKQMVEKSKELRNCPVTTGALQPDWRDPPCLRCNWCLPV